MHSLSNRMSKKIVIIASLLIGLAVVYVFPYRGNVAAYLTPIRFFGKVIDQHGVPVPHADVKLYVNDNFRGGSSSIFTLKTDQVGRFSITEARGLTLWVEVSKPGYRVLPRVDEKVTSSGRFDYGVSPHGPYRSDKDTPTVFTLYKAGFVEPLLKIGKENIRMARDGTPKSISLDRQEGSHQVILRCWSKDLELPAGQYQFDWRFEISIPEGGLIARKDAFVFEAPRDGYVPNEIVDMHALLPQDKWRSSVKRAYFIRFGDGTFARAKLEMEAGGDHFAVWESFLNPKVGSRNLEDDSK